MAKLLRVKCQLAMCFDEVFRAEFEFWADVSLLLQLLLFLLLMRK